MGAFLSIFFIATFMPCYFNVALFSKHSARIRLDNLLIMEYNLPYLRQRERRTLQNLSALGVGPHYNRIYALNMLKPDIQGINT